MTKRKYLTISEGYTARDAKTIIAISDEKIINRVAKEISDRLKEPSKSTSHQQNEATD